MMWGGKEEDIRRQELLLLLLLLLFLLVLLVVVVVVFAVERIIPLRFLLFFFCKRIWRPPRAQPLKKKNECGWVGPAPAHRCAALPGSCCLKRMSGRLRAAERVRSTNGEKFVRTREEDVSDPKERPGGTHSLGDPLVEMIESRNSCRGISSSPSRRTGRHRN